MASINLSVQGSSVAYKPGRNAMQIKNMLKPVVNAEEAWALMEDKFRSRFKSVREAFCRIDADSDGVISDKEMRVSLAALGLEMTNGEYRKLWRRFDTSGDGSISYAEFNNKVGRLIHPEGIMVLNRPETPKIKDWQRKAIARGLKKKVKNLDLAFKEVDKDGSGRISHPEFIQLLRQLGLAKIGHEESWQMMVKARKPGNDSLEMTIDEFKDAMMEYMRIPDELLGEDAEEGPKPPDLQAAEKMLQEKLFNKFSTVQKTFRQFDDDKSGELTYDEFRKALKTLNIVLTDDQFYALVKKFDTDLSGAITYDEFNGYLGPLLHPEAKDRSRAMAEVEDYGGMQDGLVFRPDFHNGKDLRKRGFERKEDEEIGDDIDARVHGRDGEAMDAGEDDPRARADSSPELMPGHAAGPAAEARNNSGMAAGRQESGVRPPAAVSSSGASFLRPVARPAGRAGSIATADMDLSMTEEKMRRLLGRSWVQVFSDVKRAAGPSSGSIHLEPEQFRDVMAEKGVPLTSKEVRALTLRYSAENGRVDAEGLLKGTFRNGAGIRPASAAVRSSPHRAISGRPPMAATGAARTSAFVRPSTAGPSSSMRAQAAPGLTAAGKIIF